MPTYDVYIKAEILIPAEDIQAHTKEEAKLKAIDQVSEEHDIGKIISSRSYLTNILGDKNVRDNSRS